MKRFVVFGGAQYYAAGGFHDVIAEADHFDEAMEFADRLIGCRGYADESSVDLEVYTEIEWAQVVDTAGMQIYNFGVPPYGARTDQAGSFSTILDRDGAAVILGSDGEFCHVARQAQEAKK